MRSDLRVARPQIAYRPEKGLIMFSRKRRYKPLNEVYGDSHQCVYYGSARMCIICGRSKRDIEWLGKRRKK